MQGMQLMQQMQDGEACMMHYMEQILLMKKMDVKSPMFIIQNVEKKVIELSKRIFKSKFFT